MKQLWEILSGEEPHTPLSPCAELEHYKEIYGAESNARLFEALTHSFNVLQSRAQMLLGLMTICLTITGFSGPTIAASSIFARLSIAFGLLFVLLAVLTLLTGPLHLKWVTRYRCETIEKTLIMLIRRRNIRTTKYRLAAFFLIVGLTGYVSSVLSFLLKGM